uniref:Histone H2A n=1 Tax=Timema genevievae TaxID=629358 RepID=A0A7R9KB84_TIMGE|nr:unnamed protein product [Timema genevievae]
MSGRGKGGKVRGKSKSRSSRAGLQFPVGRIHHLLRKGNYAERVGSGAPVYHAAVMEYLAAEVLELATQHVTTRKLLSSHVIFNRLFAMTKNSTNFSQGHGLPFGVLRIGYRVANDVFKKHLEYATRLLIDEARDSLDSPSTSETANGRFGDALDVVTKDLSVTLRATFPSFLPPLPRPVIVSTAYVAGSNSKWATPFRLLPD